MLIKGYYLLINSFKNVIRTKGILSTFLLSILISAIAFFSFNVYAFFSHLQKNMTESIDKETDLTEIQMNAAPLMAMAIFKFAALLLFIALLLLTIANIKRSFSQFFVAQKNEFKIMFLLGESLLFLRLFNACQVLLFSIFSLAIGSLIGTKIFYEAVIKTIQIGIVSEDVNTFHGDTLLLIFVLILSLIFVFLSTFMTSNKRIESYVL